MELPPRDFSCLQEREGGSEKREITIAGGGKSKIVKIDLCKCSVSFRSQPEFQLG